MREDKYPFISKSDMKKRQREISKIYWAERKMRIYKHYSEGKICCKCCGEKELAFLCLDHIRNNGAEHRREIGRGAYMTLTWILKNNYPDGFQVLCYNCNQAKRVSGICPHVMMSAKE